MNTKNITIVSSTIIILTLFYVLTLYNNDVGKMNNYALAGYVAGYCAGVYGIIALLSLILDLITWPIRKSFSFFKIISSNYFGVMLIIIIQSCFLYQFIIQKKEVSHAINKIEDTIDNLYAGNQLKKEQPVSSESNSKITDNSALIINLTNNVIIETSKNYEKEFSVIASKDEELSNQLTKYFKPEIWLASDGIQNAKMLLKQYGELLQYKSQVTIKFQDDLERNIATQLNKSSISKAESEVFWKSYIRGSKESEILLNSLSEVEGQTIDLMAVIFDFINTNRNYVINNNGSIGFSDPALESQYKQLLLRLIDLSDKATEISNTMRSRAKGSFEKAKGI